MQALLPEPSLDTFHSLSLNVETNNLTHSLFKEMPEENLEQPRMLQEGVARQKDFKHLRINYKKICRHHEPGLEIANFIETHQST